MGSLFAQKTSYLDEWNINTEIGVEAIKKENDEVR